MNEEVKTKVKEFFNSYPLLKEKKGKILIHAGDDPKGVIYLVTGEVAEYDIAGNGEQIVVNVFKPPAFFPMSWAINRTANQYFFETTSEIEYRLAPADHAVKFLRQNPDVTFDLLARVYSGTDGLLRRMAHLMGGSARSRLLFELKVQATRFGVKGNNGTVLLKMNEHDLAKRAGLSRETVSRELSNLKDAVVVNRDGFLISDVSAFEKELGKEL